MLLKNTKETQNCQPVTFFALQDNNGDIVEQRGFKHPNTLRHAKQFADFMCISDHDSAWYMKDGERQFGKTKENIYQIKFSYLDLDCNSDIEISQDVIIQRCNYYKLPLPTYINKTSPNRFQTLWEFEKPVILNSEKMLSFWESVQRRLYEAFKDLGADINCLDANRYLRNPYNNNNCNKKYDNWPEIEINDFKRKTSLSDLHTALTSDDLNPTKGARPIEIYNGIQFSVSRHKIKEFFINNPNFKGTYKTISELLGIPLRSLYKIMRGLRDSNIVKVENIRIGSTYISKFSLLIFHTAYKVISTPSLKKRLEKIKECGFIEGFRNGSYFNTIVLLKTFFKKKDFEILNGFKGYLHGFPEKEFEKIVKSAYKKNYKGRLKWIVGKHWNYLQNQRITG